MLTRLYYIMSSSFWVSRYYVFSVQIILNYYIIIIFNWHLTCNNQKKQYLHSCSTQLIYKKYFCNIYQKVCIQDVNLVDIMDKILHWIYYKRRKYVYASSYLKKRALNMGSYNCTAFSDGVQRAIRWVYRLFESFYELFHNKFSLNNQLSCQYTA